MFEESLRETSSVRQVVPPDHRRVEGDHVGADAVLPGLRIRKDTRARKGTTCLPKLTMHIYIYI